tara:strand:- start:398 stop:961 length:564 start_codon:yes stop_codon:yes gene_type:complete
MTAIAAKIPDKEVLKEKIRQAGKKVEEKATKVPNAVWYTLFGLGALYAGVQIFKSLGKNENDEEFDDGEEEVEKKETTDGSTKASITKNEALSIANGQAQVMRSIGAWFDIEELTKPLESLNGKDLQLVYNAFGTRFYDRLLVAGGGSYDLHSISLDLGAWYQNELEDDEKEIMREIWVKSNLNLGI